MTVRSPARSLGVALLAYAVASFAHHVHNAELLAAYPNLPPGLTRPVVYAAWAVRPGVELGPVADALAQAKRRGVANIGQIAAREAARLGLDAGFCRRYLGNIIRFDLGTAELAGLQRYYDLACELELAPPGVEIRLHEPAFAACGLAKP